MVLALFREIQGSASNIYDTLISEVKEQFTVMAFLIEGAKELLDDKINKLVEFQHFIQGSDVFF